jgi:hypothetical protein
LKTAVMFLLGTEHVDNVVLLSHAFVIGSTPLPRLRIAGKRSDRIPEKAAILR